jgi:hypothetical protein
MRSLSDQFIEVSYPESNLNYLVAWKDFNNTLEFLESTEFTLKQNNHFN